MAPTVFESRPLPTALALRLRQRLAVEHEREPFSTVDARRTIRRVRDVLTDLDLQAGMYRGGLDLRGIEVDHVWLAVSDGGQPPFVVDAAFPLFAEDFVTALRRFVSGEVATDELAAVAAGTGVEKRVLGEYPAPMRYRGRPVWTQRPLDRYSGAVTG